MADESSRRVELVAETDNSKREAGRTGLGLLIGFVLGRQSLVGAATGTEQFEFAIAHFVGLVLASVAGVLLIGVLYDRNARIAAKTEAAEQAADEANQAPELGAEPTSPSPELPIGMPT